MITVYGYSLDNYSLIEEAEKNGKEKTK